MVTETEQMPKTTGQKILSTGYKVSGWQWRMKAIKTFIVGGLLIIGGIVLAVITKTFTPLILIAIGLVAIFFGWIQWRRTKSLVKGRFY